MASIATPAEAGSSHPNHDDINPAQEISELHKLGVIGTPRANSELLFEGGGMELSKDLVLEVEASMTPKRKRSDSLDTQPGSDIDSDDVDDINDFLGVCTPVVCDGASAKKPKVSSDSQDVIDLTKKGGVKSCQEQLMKELKKLEPIYTPYGMQFQVSPNKRVDVQIVDGSPSAKFDISTMQYYKNEYGAYFGKIDEDPTAYTTNSEKIGEVAANIAATVQGLRLKYNAEA